MKLSVSSKNEYLFFPEVGDNLQKPESDRFTIVVKKVNQILSGAAWFKYNSKYEYTGVDNKAKIRDCIKEIRNAPILQIDDGTERELTIDDLLSEEFPELFDITLDLNSFILKLDSEGSVETKKS